MLDFLFDVKSSQKPNLKLVPFVLRKEGDQSKEGSWAKGKALDGEGEYQWLDEPKVEGKAPKLDQVTPKMYGTPPEK